MDMKILFLEDEYDFAESICRSFSMHKITYTNDLVRFDSYLYENPGAKYYDIILMDLNVELIDMDDYQFFKLCSFDNMIEKFELTNTIAGITLSLLGWDYFVHKVMQHIATKMSAFQNFYFLTGHYDTIKECALLEKQGISPKRLLDKSKCIKALEAIIY